MSESITQDLYQTLIMDRARTPRHAGTLAEFDAEAEGDNPMCGDRVHLQLQCGDGTVVCLRHQTRGCAICVSAADLMGDAVTGKDTAAIYDIATTFERMIVTGTVPDRNDFSELRALAGVHEYRSRHRCALLPWQALRVALAMTMEPENG